LLYGVPEWRELKTCEVLGLVLGLNEGLLICNIGVGFIFYLIIYFCITFLFLFFVNVSG